MHIGIGVDTGLRQVVAQQKVVHAVLERNGKFKALPVFGVAVVFVLERQGNGLAIDVLNGGHIHGGGIRAQAQGNR